MVQKSGWLKVACLSLAMAVTMAGCGGGKPDEPKTATQTDPTTPAKPLAVAANFTIKGKVGADRLYGGSVINAYDFQGKLCTSTKADGATSDFTLTGKCGFPVVLSADLPDGNDVMPLPDGVKGEGRQWYAVVPQIMKDGDSFVADVNPLTTAVTVLTLGRLPIAGLANGRTVLTPERLNAGMEKIGQAIKQFMDATGVTATDLWAAPAAGSPLASMLQMVRVQTVRIDSTKQTLVKFQSATEHRPIVLVLTDGKGVAEAYIDSGLGMDAAEVSQPELNAGVALLPTLSNAMQDFVNAPFTQIDLNCFMHNGLQDPMAIFDLPPGWTLDSGVKAENPRLLRINTFTNLVNETLETRNTGGAKLAYISFDFRDMRGMKRRSYTWMIKGDQTLDNGCRSTGSAWRVLGNQRPVYMRTSTYALHDISYNQKFAARVDTKGVGTEHFIGLDGPDGGFSHVLINGPAVPGDAKVFINVGGSYLLSTLDITKLRVFGNTLNDPEATEAAKALAMKAITDSIQETRAIVMTDPEIKSEITDSFFDEQNTYTYRYFNDFADLTPKLTLQDILPKRPYLAAELTFDYFHSMGINLDNLVRGMEHPEPVTINWSLPNDLRGKAMTPLVAFFERISCYESGAWPKCFKRSEYISEYGISMFYILDSAAQSAVLTPNETPKWQKEEGGELLPTFMRRAKARMTVLDSLNRPLETAVSMDYSR